MKHFLYFTIALPNFYLFANDSLIQLIDDLNIPKGIVVETPNTNICTDPTDDAVNCFNDICGNIPDRENSLIQKIMDIANHECLDELKNNDDKIKEIVTLSIDNRFKQISNLDKYLKEINYDIPKHINKEQLNDLIVTFIVGELKSFSCDNAKEKLSDRMTITLSERLEKKSNAYKKIIYSSYESLLSRTQEKDSLYQNQQFLSMLLRCGFFKESEYKEVASKLFSQIGDVNNLYFSVPDPNKSTITISDLERLIQVAEFTGPFPINANNMSKDDIDMIFRESFYIDRLKNKLKDDGYLDPALIDAKFKLLRTQLLSQCMHDQYISSSKNIAKDLMYRYATKIAELTDPNIKEDLLNHLLTEVSVEFQTKALNLSSKIKELHEIASKEPVMNILFLQRSASFIANNVSSTMRSLFNDERTLPLDAFPLDDATWGSGIDLSTESLVNLENDDTMFAHEVSHVITDPDNPYQQKATNHLKKRIQEIENCMQELHIKPEVYKKEIRADTISAFISKSGTFARTNCSYIYKEGLSLEPATSSIHPTTFFRLIYTSFLKGNYPKSCQKVIENSNGRFKMKKCI